MIPEEIDDHLDEECPEAEQRDKIDQESSETGEQVDRNQKESSEETQEDECYVKEGDLTESSNLEMISLMP